MQAQSGGGLAPGQVLAVGRAEGREAPRLLEVDEAVVASLAPLAFRGKADGFAALAGPGGTADLKFVETSNSLLLGPPARATHGEAVLVPVRAGFYQASGKPGPS